MPGTTAITFSNEQLATQTMNYLKDYRRLRQYNYPLAQDVLKNEETWDGSDTIVVPWEDQEHSQATPLVTGYERWNDAVSTTMIAGRVSPAWVVMPIMISEIDQLLNSGPGKVIDRLKKNAANVNDTFMRNFQKVIMLGPASSGTYVAPFGFSNWNTFNGVDFSTGFFQNVAQGGNTLHGVSQSGYAFATYPQFSNLTFDVNSLAGTNLATMMYQGCVRMSMQDQWPTAAECKWYVTEALVVNLKRFMRTFEQYIDVGARGLDDGMRRPVGPGGVPLEPIFDMPLNGTNTAGSKISGLLVNWKRGVDVRLFNGWKMTTDKYQDIPGTVGVKAALMKLGGNIICRQPGLQITLKNAETF